MNNFIPQPIFLSIMNIVSKKKKSLHCQKKRKKGIEFHGRLQSVYCTMYNRIVQITNIVLKDILRAELRDQADDTSLDLPIHY